MPVKFVTNADGKGWLTVRYSDDNSTYPPLPQFLRVNYIKTEGGRDYFQVTEGKAAGRFASVRLRNDGGSYLTDGDPTLPAGSAMYVKSSGRFRYALSLVPGVTITTDPGNPVPAGVHDLEIPDEVHPGGDAYEPISTYAKSWFRIGHSGDRYLHTGSRSAGCATVTDVARWTEIYLYLIRRRKGDGRSVGTLEVYETEAGWLINIIPIGWLKGLLPARGGADRRATTGEKSFDVANPQNDYRSG